jgi:hypothetical protein
MLFICPILGFYQGKGYLRLMRAGLIYTVVYQEKVKEAFAKWLAGSGCGYSLISFHRLGQSLTRHTVWQTANTLFLLLLSGELSDRLRRGLLLAGLRRE